MLPALSTSRRDVLSMPEAATGSNIAARVRAPAIILVRRPDFSARAERTVGFVIISSSCRWKTDPSDREKAEGEHEPMHYSRPAPARSCLHPCAHFETSCLRSFLLACEGALPGAALPAPTGKDLGSEKNPFKRRAQNFVSFEHAPPDKLTIRVEPDCCPKAASVRLTAKNQHPRGTKVRR